MAKSKVPPPRSTPQPYSNGLEHEPPSGVFHIRTGRTRKMVKWGAVIGAITALLTPVMNALSSRITSVPESRIERELRELKEMLSRDGGPN